MIVVVNDANILIDLVELELYDAFFTLDYSFQTTNLIIEELDDEQVLLLRPYIDKGILIEQEIEGDQLDEIEEIRKERPGLSIQDCSAYHMAQSLDATLVTSDNTLRKFAKHKKLEVHGHLWVFDRLVEAKIIGGEIACDKLVELNTVVNQKLGLPKVECEKRMKQWQAGK